MKVVSKTAGGGAPGLDVQLVAPSPSEQPHIAGTGLVQAGGG